MPARAYAIIGIGMIFLMAVLVFVSGYAIGRAGIAKDCEDFRAFTFSGEAWGCVRLKRRVHDDWREPLPQRDERVKT